MQYQTKTHLGYDDVGLQTAFAGHVGTAVLAHVARRNDLQTRTVRRFLVLLGTLGY